MGVEAEKLPQKETYLYHRLCLIQKKNLMKRRQLKNAKIVNYCWQFRCVPMVILPRNWLINFQILSGFMVFCTRREQSLIKTWIRLLNFTKQLEKKITIKLFTDSDLSTKKDFMENLLNILRCGNKLVKMDIYRLSLIWDIYTKMDLKMKILDEQSWNQTSIKPSATIVKLHKRTSQELLIILLPFISATKNIEMKKNALSI